MIAARHARSVACMKARLQSRGLFESLLIVALYLGSELSRGLASGGAAAAQVHAATVIRIERRLHVFSEASVQHAVHKLWSVPALLGYAYVSLHIVVTAALLVWVYRAHRAVYPLLRNTLVLANGIAIVGYWLFPTAPPRLAGVGISDTVSSATSIDLTSNLASTFYNPYAAVPSMHIGFSVLVGATVVKLARSRRARIAGAVSRLRAARDRRDRQPLLPGRRSRCARRGGRLRRGARGVAPARRRVAARALREVGRAVRGVDRVDDALVGAPHR